MAKPQSRDPLERYDTPPWVTQALVEYGPLSAALVVEPCAGRGAIVDVLAHAGCNVAAFDIDPRREDISSVDTLVPGFFEQIAMKAGGDLALITNPPFSLAADYCRRGAMFRRTALLVRITWLERTRDRVDIPDPVRVIVLPRPKFVGKGSDSATCVWACWGDWAPGIVRLSRQDVDGLSGSRWRREDPA